MKKYTIEITETLTRIVSIEAETEYEAERIVREKYKNCEIVLDADDFVGYETHIFEWASFYSHFSMIVILYSPTQKRGKRLFFFYFFTLMLYYSIH